jgi:hypothetical protein
MEKEIFWSVYVNTRKKEFAEKMFGDILNVIGNNCKLVKIEKYWKDDDLYLIEILQEIKVGNAESFILFFLETLSLISNKWIFNLPHSFNREDCDMSGLTKEGIKLRGLYWISFDINDKEYDQ